MTTNEIFKRMLDWLYANTEAKNQADVARQAGLNETTVSRIANDRVKSVKLETLRAVNAAFGNVFNPAWLRGASDVMLTADAKRQESAQVGTAMHGAPSPTPSATAVDALTAALLASKDETITAQKRELAAKDALIANLQQQLTDLRTQLAVEKGLLTGTSPSAPAEPERGQPYV